MSLAIYRKYRPQKWSDLTGQNHVKVTLQNEIESGKIAHAYLFTGPRGIGKTTTARLLAKAVNCLDRKENQSEPCGKCESCTELVAGNDLDIMEIDAASHTGVDNVRENIIANARFTPAKRKYKVFIIDEVHMLSISAFNALLKILEEPPAHAIFVLATTEVHKVPATIISRCQRFDFKKVTPEDLVKRLSNICTKEGIKISDKVLADIARVSDGCLRDAESLLGQVLSLGDKEITDEEASLIIPASNYKLVLQLVNNLVLKNSQEGVNLINKLIEEGVDLLQFTDELIEFLRKVLLNKISGSLKEFAFDLDEEVEKAIIDLSQKFTVNDLVDLIDLFLAKKADIKSAVIVQLPLELAVIEYCNQNKAEQINEKDDDKGNGLNSNETKADSSKIQSRPLKAEIKNEEETKSSGPQKATLKNVKIKLEDIKKKWHDFLVELQNHNASLVFILKVAEPLEINGNVLKIGFKYDFHCQRVNQAKVKDSLESVLSDFFKENLAIESALLDKDHESEFIKSQTEADEVELVDELPEGEGSGDQQALIDNLVKTFKGKVIED